MMIKSGDKFGKLTVIEQAGVDSIQNTVWKCKCECGREHFISQRSLSTGNTLSCGCLRGHPSDFTGMRFNFLVGVRPSCRRGKSGNLYWWWMCDCGNMKEIMPGNVMRKKNPTKSCGCYRRRVVYNHED